MKKRDRTLSYAKSQRLTESDLQCVSAASGTVHTTMLATYYPAGGVDVCMDTAND
jgi:hypothetical protein